MYTNVVGGGPVQSTRETFAGMVTLRPAISVTVRYEAFCSTNCPDGSVLSLTAEEPGVAAGASATTLFSSTSTTYMPHTMAASNATTTIHEILFSIDLTLQYHVLSGAQPDCAAWTPSIISITDMTAGLPAGSGQPVNPAPRMARSCPKSAMIRNESGNAFRRNADERASVLFRNEIDGDMHLSAIPDTVAQDDGPYEG